MKISKTKEELVNMYIDSLKEGKIPWRERWVSSLKNIQDWIENRYSKKIEKLRPKLINYKDKLIIVHNYKELDKLIENFNEHKDG